MPYCVMVFQISQMNRPDVSAINASIAFGLETALHDLMYGDEGRKQSWKHASGGLISLQWKFRKPDDIQDQTLHANPITAESQWDWGF